MRQPVRLMMALLSAACWGASAAPSCGQFVLDIRHVADQAFPQVEEQAPASTSTARNRVRFNVEQNIDGWVFNQFGNATAARQHLDTQLKMAIESIHRDCQLSGPQREKLQLAGLGDITTFFAGVAAIREEFRGEQDQQMINQVWQRVQPFQQRMQGNLFGRDSILQRVADASLDEMQLKRYRAAELQRQRFAYRAAAKLAIANIEKTAPLKATQRNAVFEKLAGTPPPKVVGNYTNYYVLYQLSRLRSQGELQEILDKQQLVALQALLAQGQGMEQFLRQNGYLD